LRERAVHLVVDRVERADVEEPAADAGLVGRDDGAIAGLVQARDGLEATGNRNPFFRRLDELVAVDVDDAVAVEDDELRLARPGGSLRRELDHAGNSKRDTARGECRWAPAVARGART
jgi:hypothetical protein